MYKYAVVAERTTLSLWQKRKIRPQLERISLYVNDWMMEGKKDITHPPSRWVMPRFSIRNDAFFFFLWISFPGFENKISEVFATKKKKRKHVSPSN